LLRNGSNKDFLIYAGLRKLRWAGCVAQTGETGKVTDKTAEI
jgi:hypothetical protein